MPKQIRLIFRFLAIALILALLRPSAASATTVIAELGSAPLLGQTETLAQLQVNVARNEDRLATAAALAGMTGGEFRAFRDAVQTVKPAWGLVPRHLSAMTWFDGSKVRVIRDVLIPAATYGFEYDESSANARLRIFVPVACGNLSILRERIVRAAALPPRREVASRPVAMVPPVSATPPPAPVQVATPATSAAPSPVPSPTTIQLGSRPKRGIWPFFAVLFGFLDFGGGGGNGGPIHSPSCACRPH
ncbi:MAG TPA: hypothetical protein VKT51_06265 [Candidatus Eremiobacteraceae bacterium]|nr:hypothetical protein [Candidatus Eremiobacteraceae bacterium]